MKSVGVLLLTLAVAAGCLIGPSDAFKQVWVTNDLASDLFVVEEGQLNRDDPVRVLTVEVSVPAHSTRRVLDNSAGEGSFLRFFDSDCNLLRRLALTNNQDTLISVNQAFRADNARPANPASISDARQVRHCLTSEYPVVTDFP